MTTPHFPRTVLGLLDQAASLFPTRRAVSDEYLTVDYAGLRGRVTAAAELLRRSGIRHGDRVAIQLPNSVAFVEAVLAVLRCGATAMPVPPSLPATELRRLLEGSQCVAAISAAGDLPLAVPVQIAAGTAGLHIARGSARANVGRATEPTPTDLALVAFSSGAAAPPHLVSRTHENLWWEAENFGNATGLGCEDVVLGVVPLSHAHGFGNAFLAALRARARLVLRPRFLRRQTLDLLVADRVTLFPCVPFMLRMLAVTDPRRRWDLATLRLCLSAGAPLPRETFVAFRDRFGVPPRQLYGLTEAGSVTCDLADVADVDPATVGGPLGNVAVTIETPDGRRVAMGEPGEVVIHSPAAEGTGTAPLRTRDLGQLDASGRLTITGRTSRFINVAGNKIDPAEVEAALRAHPAVADVAVFGIEDAHDEQVVAAAVVLAEPLSADALRSHCRHLLAPYKVPRILSIRSALPRSPLGKVLIGRLAVGARRSDLLERASILRARTVTVPSP